MSEINRRYVALVADDIPVHCDNMGDILEHLAPRRIGISFEVHRAANFQEFEAAVRDGLKPDVIFLDNNFEYGAGMDNPANSIASNEGLERFMSAIGTWINQGVLPDHLTTILVTAGEWRPSENRPAWLDIGMKATEKGVFRVLPKPYETNEFLEAAMAAVERIRSFSGDGL